MVLLWPLAYPLSKILDCILGAEVSTVYNREHLLQLIREHQKTSLKDDDHGAITGALTYTNVLVNSVMTAAKV
jgi:metal transporter CNNM